MRIAIVALGVLGFVAGSFFPTVLAMALWAYTMYGAGITPALLAALVWPRATQGGGHLFDRRRHVGDSAVGIVAVARGTSRRRYILRLQTIYPALSSRRWESGRENTSADVRSAEL